MQQSETTPTPRQNVNLNSVEEVFCFNVKFMQHLKRVEQRQRLETLPDDTSVVC